MAEAEAESCADPLWDDWEAPPRIPSAPDLHLDGFDGPLDLLLDLAERTRLDLTRISVRAFVDQVVDALARLEGHVALERRADWLVLAARFLVLRARLLFARSPEAEQAEQAVAREIARTRDLQVLRAATSWLEARPQLGRDVFGRPQAERDPRIASTMRLMETCLTVLQGRDGQPANEEPVYRVVIPAAYRLPEAIMRMRRMLAEMDGPLPLEAFAPEGTEILEGSEMLRRAGMAGTFLAALELARSDEVKLTQHGAFDRLLVDFR
jgi:segregation and condensation protein A